MPIGIENINSYTILSNGLHHFGYNIVRQCKL